MYFLSFFEKSWCFLPAFVCHVIVRHKLQNKILLSTTYFPVFHLVSNNIISRPGGVV
jgi:hypothetical protein